MRVFTICLLFLPIITSQKWLRTNLIDESYEDSPRERGRLNIPIMSHEKNGDGRLDTPSKEIPSQLINRGSENRRDTDDKKVPFPIPFFLRRVSQQAKNEFFQIFQVIFLSKQKQIEAMNAWAKKYKVESEVKDFERRVEESRLSLEEDISSTINSLPDAFQKLAEDLSPTTFSTLLFIVHNVIRRNVASIQESNENSNLMNIQDDQPFGIKEQERRNSFEPKIPFPSPFGLNRRDQRSFGPGPSGPWVPERRDDRPFPFPFGPDRRDQRPFGPGPSGPWCPERRDDRPFSFPFGSDRRDQRPFGPGPSGPWGTERRDDRPSPFPFGPDRRDQRPFGPGPSGPWGPERRDDRPFPFPFGPDRRDQRLFGPGPSGPWGPERRDDRPFPFPFGPDRRDQGPFLPPFFENGPSKTVISGFDSNPSIGDIEKKLEALPIRSDYSFLLSPSKNSSQIRPIPSPICDVDGLFMTISL
ncbi:hypothetical protein PRIPAC_90512 [Pristionchus pacificus]|uniref:DUF148 domain-containing protein n=1 Tax=Pristionchus pacificus TaxID=54126 RepID=A0A2A6CIS6_PRIPA|nr:hypothetical protein PRIPAC_90512 [Pristionchus pacificus]|eukprot:PDM78134.1 hypothetical protein PRIPAC_30519 [Pristionchus pacificus]